MLYLRMLLLMAVSLYTSRVVLIMLGVEDYGIYNVVGGFVSMFSFINAALTTGTQRYITYSLGLKDGSNIDINKVFSTCVLAHALIACIIFLLAETVGLWFVLNKLTIPANRMTAAMWVYQCSILSSIVVVMSVPYNADIIAHEKMSAFAYISLTEAFMKLCIVFLLPIGDIDRLILYAMLLLLIQILIRTIYTSYCYRHFPESHVRLVYDKNLFREIISFSSWNLFGSLAHMLSSQGLNVLLNMFFGPIVNAARGVAVQVQSAVYQFASNFQVALNPQITKSYASEDLSRMHSLICKSSKFSCFILLLLAAPLGVGIHLILNLWLKEVPEYTDVFILLLLCITILEAMANPFVVSAAATGRVKVYQSVIGCLMLCIVPLSYVFLRLGGSPYMVFVAHIIVAIIAFIVRLLILRPMIRMPIRSYVVRVIVPCVEVFVLVSSIAIVLYFFYTTGVSQTLISMIISFIASVIIIYFIGLSKSEKTFLIEKIKSYKSRISRKVC